jgi:hypothetical protein
VVKKTITKKRRFIFVFFIFYISLPSPLSHLQAPKEGGLAFGAWNY